MNKPLWWLKTLPLAVLALFGFFCLNYTNGFGIAHHADWAEAHGMPPPTYQIFLTGITVLAVGSGLVGYVVGRSSRKTGKGDDRPELRSRHV